MKTMVDYGVDFEDMYKLIDPHQQALKTVDQFSEIWKYPETQRTVFLTHFWVVPHGVWAIRLEHLLIQFGSHHFVAYMLYLH